MVRASPQALGFHEARGQTREVFIETQDRRTSCLPSQMLGYHQPRDSHVHGSSQPAEPQCVLADLRAE